MQQTTDGSIAVGVFYLLPRIVDCVIIFIDKVGDKDEFIATATVFT